MEAVAEFDNETVREIGGHDPLIRSPNQSQKYLGDVYLFRLMTYGNRFFLQYVLLMIVSRVTET